MTKFTLTEMKRLLPSYVPEDRRDAARSLWSTLPRAEQEEVLGCLQREFYRKKGVDVDAPTVKTLRRITLEEKNKQHEEFHREWEQFLAED